MHDKKSLHDTTKMGYERPPNYESNILRVLGKCFERAYYQEVVGTSDDEGINVQSMPSMFVVRIEFEKILEIYSEQASQHKISMESSNFSFLVVFLLQGSRVCLGASFKHVRSHFL